MVLDVRAALKLRGHTFETHENQFEEVGEALYELAAELLPDSPGAVRQRLRQRVLAGARELEDIQALALEDYAAFDYLLLAAVRGTDEAVLHASRYIWSTLQKRGHKYPPQGFSQYVRVVLDVVFYEIEQEARDGYQ